MQVSFEQKGTKGKWKRQLRVQFSPVLRKFDLLLEGVLLLELKAVQKVLPIHKAQLLSYVKLLDVPFGLVMNLHELKIVDGAFRMMLPGANQDR